MNTVQYYTPSSTHILYSTSKHSSTSAVYRSTTVLRLLMLGGGTTTGSGLDDEHGAMVRSSYWSIDYCT